MNANSNYLDLAVTFVTKVILDDWYWLISIIYLLLFIFLYYACRYIWKPWFGYFTLSLLFYITFLGCSWAGMYKGRIDATDDKFETSTSKSVIKLYGKDLGSECDYYNGSYRLLYEDAKWIFVFMPPGVRNSEIILHAVLKSKIERYEVTVK